MSDERVIIVGAGPIGLGSALELARFGVRSLVIEKHPWISWHPKTRNFNTRTMEIARGWGEAAYQRFRNIDTPPGWKSPIRFLSSATGEQYSQIDSKGFEGPGPDISAAEPVMSSQELIEEIMVDAALATGLVEFRFSTEVTKLVSGGEQNAAGAAIQIKDRTTGKVETISGPALVAADGADSFIRKSLRLELEGVKNLRHMLNCYFRADIESHLNGRHGVLLFFNNELAGGVLQPLDAKGRWLSQINVAEEQWSEEYFTKERARDWVRAAAGVPDLEVEVMSLGFWRLNATVVERMVQGRIVLCGDAAHQFPPTGGLGVNTGLQGMHNAMWKLALFIKGQAGWPLVETYHMERRPVSKSIVDQSLENSINVAMIFSAAESGADTGMSAEQVTHASRRYGNHLGIEFGACYASDAVTPDGSAPPDVADSYSDYAPSATPGCRAPHVWLGNDREHISTHALFGSGFTLLTGADGQDWLDAARALQRELGVRIDAYRIGGSGLQDAGGFAEAYGIESSGAVLVRPDGHIAWRAKSAEVGGSSLKGALQKLLQSPAKPAAPRRFAGFWRRAEKATTHLGA